MRKTSSYPFFLAALLLALPLAACQNEPAPEPTEVAVVPSAIAAPSETASPEPSATASHTPIPLPPTATPEPPTATTSPTETRLPTLTPSPTATPVPLPTNTATATATPIPLPTATPIPPAPPTAVPLPTAVPTEIPPPPPSDANLLPNPSFEEGHYNVNGIPEIQAPNRWILEWDEGPNPLDEAPWNVWVRPETRVLSRAFLPPHEHDLFIFDGNHTIKVFKGYGAISFRLMTDVHLEPGIYQFIINVFPDMIDNYGPNGEKYWAPNPLSGEVRFIADSQVEGWILPPFGQRSGYLYSFEVTEARTMRLGAAFRGRWAILNNGWFIDDWSLRKIS